MSVTLDGEVVRLVGDCRTEDAERLHTAVLQALLALDVVVTGEPRDAFQKRTLGRLLRRPLP